MYNARPKLMGKNYQLGQDFFHQQYVIGCADQGLNRGISASVQSVTSWVWPPLPINEGFCVFLLLNMKMKDE